MYVCQKYCLLVATSLKTNVAHNDSCAIVLVTFSLFQLHEQVLWVTGLLQPDRVSGSREHVCDEHALLQWHVHRCLWPL